MQCTCSCNGLVVYARAALAQKRFMLWLLPSGLCDLTVRKSSN
uniref:Uncharacterized protein n=1 Tax=Arundo donax TaxID=35708 RepID=A0A0A8YTZ8_ARUDO